MWFDARAKLNKIVGQPPAAFAATMPPVLQVSQRPKAKTPVLRVAKVATPARSNLEATLPAGADRLDQGPADLTYGTGRTGDTGAKSQSNGCNPHREGHARP